MSSVFVVSSSSVVEEGDGVREDRRVVMVVRAVIMVVLRGGSGSWSCRGDRWWMGSWGRLLGGIAGWGC